VTKEELDFLKDLCEEGGIFQEASEEEVLKEVDCYKKLSPLSLIDNLVFGEQDEI